MSTTREIRQSEVATPPHLDNNVRVVTDLCQQLESDGIITLPTLLSTDQLSSMQRAFEARLRHLRWNNFEGYEKSEPYRHMIEDVLLLDQGFVDLAIHPIVKGIVKTYLGSDAELTEARGWKSLPTTRDFHGWHGDAWYDQKATSKVEKELKLGFYLTDVSSGAFNYMRGSHRKYHPRPIPNVELKDYQTPSVCEVMGTAGSAFMFDTSGIHRQGVPMLEPRQAVFFNYHDPSVPLQEADKKFHRYHPLLLNAAFLGDLTPEDQKLLGFGNKTNFIPAYSRPSNPPLIYRALRVALNLQLHANSLRGRIAHRLSRNRS